MSATTGHKRIDTYPYRHAGEALGFDYVEYEIPDVEEGSLGDKRHLDLTDEEDWDTAELTVEVSVDDETLEEVFPFGAAYGDIVVIGYCPTNHYRFRSTIERSPLSPGDYTGTVEIERELLRGRIQLTPQLVRTEPLAGQPPDHEGPPYAERVGRKLAHGPTGTVDVDEPLGGKSKDLPSVPKSFSEDPVLVDGNMWHVNLPEVGSPKLYVNSDHGFVTSLLEDDGQHARGRVRRLVVDLFGTQLMTQFVVKAAELYVVNGEMRHGWQRRMLTDVCGDIFEGKSPNEVKEMLEPGALSDTINEISNTVQRRRAPHESLERVLELSL